jgi:hypothetical protein
MANHLHKYVLWLHNHTDQRDDEWLVFWAKDDDEAKHKGSELSIDRTRFSRGGVMTAKEFQKKMGMAP